MHILQNDKNFTEQKNIEFLINKKFYFCIFYANLGKTVDFTIKNMNRMHKL